jgi:hypothetical protein
MHDFVQGPDSRVVCNPRTEIEEREPGKGMVADRREYRLQKYTKGCPRHKGCQPEAEEPVGLRSGFWTRHTTTHSVKSKHQHGRCAVGPFVEKTMGAAKVLRAISQWKRGPIRVLGIPVEAATGQCPRSEKEAEPRVPEEGEVTQRRRHGGGKREWFAAEGRKQKGSRL